MHFLFFILMWIVWLPTFSYAVCIPFTEASDHVGETRCVSGKVFKVEEGNKGVRYLDFCEDYASCPFTVVVFPSDLRYVGDIRQLANITVEIHGPIKLYDGRAEIILKDARQLRGQAAKIPPLPKSYDVEKKGRYSAGKFSYPQSAKRPSPKRQKSPIPTEDQSESD